MKHKLLSCPSNCWHALGLQLPRLTLVVECYRRQTEQDTGKSPMVFHFHDEKSVYNHEGQHEPAKEKLEPATQNMSEQYSYSSWCFQTIMGDT